MVKLFLYKLSKKLLYTLYVQQMPQAATFERDDGRKTLRPYCNIEYTVYILNNEYAVKFAY
jgi:hypothetical protein